MTPIDRAALAILAALEENGVYAQAEGGDLSRTMVDGGLFDARIMVRAALEAIREPSERMRIAASKGRGRPTHAVSRDVWINMIDAALDEPKSSDLTPV